MVGHYYVNVLIIMTIVSHVHGNPSHVYPLGQCKQSPSTFQLEMLKVWQGCSQHYLCRCVTSCKIF